MKIPQEEIIRINKIEDLKKVAIINAKRQRRKIRNGKFVTVKPDKWDKVAKEYEEEINAIKSKYLK